MEFYQKLQELRKQKNLTQEELSEILFVSRTAISKWESGRGYPSIESLKAIAEFFGITIDELLSNRELISIAEKDSHQKNQHMRDLMLGLIDCSAGMLLIIPLFGQQDGDIIRQVSLLSLQDTPLFIKTAFLAIIFFIVACGIAELALQNCTFPLWTKAKTGLSMILTSLSVVIFIATLEPYAAFFTFVLLVIKGILLLKRP
ncbi:helix-turn-helix domain-containing protein [Holdemania massiliensis]|uniref:helix-turn-helix domain-containing protein n=1 Tax=Holdemania massiliensis TaxID=1468449 RepID=UPI00356367C5